MRNVVELLERVATSLADAAAKVAAFGVLTIVALLVTSSLQRYVAGAPIPITEELAGLLFLGSAFLSLGYGFTENGHVRLELLWRLLRSPWREIAEMVGFALAIVALVGLILITWQIGAESYHAGNRSEMTEIVLWPWRMLMPLGLGLFLLVLALRLVSKVLALVGGAGALAPSEEDPRS